VLSAFPVVHHQQYDLSYGSHREPRYCLRVDLEMEPGAVLHVFNCHLGLTARERTFQRKQMLSDAILLGEELHHPVVVMGISTICAGPVPIRLDHIYVSGGVRVLDCRVRNDEFTRVELRIAHVREQNRKIPAQYVDVEVRIRGGDGVP
jgi:endonuclease/exonuclease/phosphatase family metal-dependent hydrolase